MPGSSSTLLQIQGKWCQERKLQKIQHLTHKKSKNYSAPNTYLTEQHIGECYSMATLLIDLIESNASCIQPTILDVNRHRRNWQQCQAKDIDEVLLGSLYEACIRCALEQLSTRHSWTSDTFNILQPQQALWGVTRGAKSLVRSSPLPRSSKKLALRTRSTDQWFNGQDHPSILTPGCPEIKRNGIQ